MSLYIILLWKDKISHKYMVSFLYKRNLIQSILHKIMTLGIKFKVRGIMCRTWETNRGTIKTCGTRKSGDTSKHDREKYIVEVKTGPMEIRYNVS